MQGFPPHHYAQKHPLPPGPGDVLYVDRYPPACPNAAVTPAGGRLLAPALGFETHEVHAWRVPPRLLVPLTPPPASAAAAQAVTTPRTASHAAALARAASATRSTGHEGWNSDEPRPKPSAPAAHHSAKPAGPTPPTA